MLSLHDIEDHLINIDDNDRIKFYRIPFESAIKALLLRKSLITNDVYREISYIMLNYFNEVNFKCFKINFLYFRLIILYGFLSFEYLNIR